MLKLNAIKLQKILLAGLISISVMACLSNPTKLIAPTKPSLNVIQMEDGSMCMSSENAEKLGIYILELERAVQ